MKYFHKKYIKYDVPLYTFGASSGGRFVGYFHQQAKSSKINIAGTIIQISSLYVPKQKMVKDSSPIVFIHMPKDEMLADLIKEKVTLLKQDKIPTMEFQAKPKPLHEKFFMYADVLASDESKRFFDALKANNYLDKDGLLISDPRSSDWRKVRIKFI